MTTMRGGKCPSFSLTLVGVESQATKNREFKLLAMVVVAPMTTPIIVPITIVVMLT
jgi:hypothetical protein